MNKKEKLNYYRKVRAIRDELLISKNEGRQRRLVMELPNTSSIYLRSGSLDDSCKVELNNGYTIYHTGDDCLVKCGIEAYMYWLKRSPLKNSQMKQNLKF